MRRTEGEASARAAEAHDRALLGDFEELEALLAAPPPGDGADLGAWWLCLEALRALATREPTRAPDVDALLAVADAPEPALLACAHLALGAAIDFDADKTEALAGASARIAAGASDPELVVLAERTRLLADVFVGANERGARAQELGREAARLGMSAVTVEASVLAALDRLEHGELEEATATARRACRMARAEGLVQQEYFASIVLARVRRHAGRAAHASRILGALAEVAPRVWWRWLDWELAFAGAPGELTLERARVWPELSAGIGAARAGDRAAFEHAFDRSSALASGFAGARRDVERVREALDPDRTPDVARGFCLGTEHRTVEGLETAFTAGEDVAPAFAMTGPGRLARRILASGVGLLRDEPPEVVASQAPRRDSRVLLLLAVLALRGDEGAPEESVFRDVYGFRYVRSKHEGVLRVLLHRARGQLGAEAQIDRVEGRLVLRAERTILVPDPRCARPLEERVLHHLGGTRAALGAKEVADALGISLRAAQRALRLLSDEGSCAVVARGRVLTYRLEDTTFFEPTKSRIGALAADAAD
jgi:hypothetical protein